MYAPSIISNIASDIYDDDLTNKLSGAIGEMG